MTVTQPHLFLILSQHKYAFLDIFSHTIQIYQWCTEQVLVIKIDYSACVIHHMQNIPTNDYNPSSIHVSYFQLSGSVIITKYLIKVSLEIQLVMCSCSNLASAIYHMPSNRWGLSAVLSQTHLHHRGEMPTYSWSGKLNILWVKVLDYIYAKYHLKKSNKLY